MNVKAVCNCNCNGNLFTHEALRSSNMNSAFKRVGAFKIELEFGSVGFLGEGKTGVHREKPLGAKERTNNKLNPHMVSTQGFKPRPHWWRRVLLPLRHPACSC